jgi:alkanesulfonate monooxygenase SsuD/methylene tetrahydromethanopterin reductase-like flavin-dependent oxidoreductase (luciferase family)
MFDEQLAALRSRLADASQAPSRARIPVYIGGHGEAAVERAARWGDGWIPGWQPFGVLRERIAKLRDRASAAGRDPQRIAIAVEMSATIAATHEGALRRYEESRFARHRRERDRSGRDLSLVTASNLVGSADSIREKVAVLAAAGVDECAALAFPAETQDELVEQWREFAEAVFARR